MSINCIAINCRLSTAFNRCFTEKWLSLALLETLRQSYCRHAFARLDLPIACTILFLLTTGALQNREECHGSSILPSTCVTSKMLLVEYFSKCWSYSLQKYHYGFANHIENFLTFLQAVDAGWWHDSPLSCCCFLSKWPLVYALVERRSDCLTW